MTLTDHRFRDLLAAFRSPEPAPGGGSASALAGAVGASLLAMVAALPKPRAAGAAEAGRLATARERCVALSDDLAALVDRDSEAYLQVVAAFRLPKATDQEKAVRGSRIQEALRIATEVPLDVMRGCAAAIEQAAVVAAFGNRNASSDLEVGLELLGAGLRGARLNVDVNLASLTDASFVAAAGKEAGRLTSTGEKAITAARASLTNGS
jgi:formiminotetrahydrofolate cyclodeaminase